MPRIISLIASATEMVCALGLEDQLVGRAHECDYPASVRKLPVCSTVAFDASGSSRDIDSNLKSHLKDGRPLYTIDADLLESLRPDVIITQSHCDVCAVKENDVEEMIGKKTSLRPKIVSLQPNRLDDVWSGIERIAEATGVRDSGRRHIDRLQTRVAAVAETARRATNKPRVACIEWIDPLMASGHWVPELIQLAGGTDLFGVSGERSALVKWKNIVTSDPEVMIVVPCGFDLSRTRRETKALSSKPEWLDMRSVVNNRVYLIDGNHYFNRPGPRLVESLEMLAEILHPDLFHFGHQNTGWEYFGIQGN